MTLFWDYSRTILTALFSLLALLAVACGGAAAPGATATATPAPTASPSSTVEAGGGSSAFTELAAWGDPLLRSYDLATLTEIQLLLQLAALQQAQGCTQDCIDMQRLSELAEDSIAQLIEEACSEGLRDPSDEWLQKLVELWAMYQSVGSGGIKTVTCIDALLSRLIARDGAAAWANPSDANLQDLAGRKALAAQLGLNQLETFASQKLANALRVLLSRGQNMCRTAPADGRAELTRALGWAALASGVDPTLVRDIQTAIDLCGGGQGPVIVTLGTLVDASESAAGAVWPQIPGCGQQQQVGEEIYIPPQVSLSTGCLGAQVSISISSYPWTTPLIVDASSSASSSPAWDTRDDFDGPTKWWGTDRTQARVLARMTFPSDGSVEIEANPYWGTGLTTIPPEGAYNQWSVQISSPTMNGVRVSCYQTSTGSTCEKWEWSSGRWTVTSGINRVTVPVFNREYWFSVTANSSVEENRIGPLDATGIGRVATIRFTPN